MIPADKILSFLALLEASERMTTDRGWYAGFHDGRRETIEQVRAYVESVSAPQPSLAEIEGRA